MPSMEYVENLFSNGKHFCVLPWIHLHVTPLGYMSLCALQSEGADSKAYGSLNEHSFHELWQGEGIRKFRLKMLADEMDERCVNCYTGQNSFRTFFNASSRKHMDWVADTDERGYAPQAKPLLWDIRFSNLCNLRCRSCNSRFSSSWSQEEKALNAVLGIPDRPQECEAVRGLKNSAELLKDLEPYYPHLATIYFAGGEPLLYRENLMILEKLDALEKYDVPLIFNTNFTQIAKNRRFLDLWKKFTKLTFWVSLDGSARQCEYLRKGLFWEDIIRNLDLLKGECPQADIIIKYTASAFNILHLPDFHREMTGRHLRADKINFNILHIPNHYSMRILPDEMKQQATRKIYEHLEWLMGQEPFVHIQDKNDKTIREFAGQWQVLIDYMNSENWTHLIPQFLEYTQRIDDLRQENCLKVFPELAPIFG
ncbi:MAG: twitch domain-containing radical SAM protein [Firmicutes bacterium]|nr:twitch domain-containing radical SAM protein [Bacillota bacterium]